MADGSITPDARSLSTQQEVLQAAGRTPAPQRAEELTLISRETFITSVLLMTFCPVFIFAGTFMLGDERELYRYCASEGLESRVGKLNVTTPALGKLVPMPEVPLGSFVEHLHRPGQRAPATDDCANPNLVAVTRKTPLDMFGKSKRHVTPVDLFGRGRRLDSVRNIHALQGNVGTSATRPKLL